MMNNIIAGLKQSKKAVEAGEAKLAYIAFDADKGVITPFLQLCETKGIEVDCKLDMKELAKLCKIEVPTAVAVVTI